MLAVDVRERNTLKIDGKICQVIERSITGTGKVGKTVHFKLKSVEDGNMLERRFRAEEKVDRVETEQHPMEYLYRDGDNFVFMDQETFEQFSLSSSIVGHAAPFMRENTKIDVLFYENKPLHVDFPKTVEMHVTNAPPPASGGQDSTWKEVEIENGLKLLAPQFIKEGDKIRIDVEQRKYVERIQDEKEKARGF